MMSLRRKLEATDPLRKLETLARSNPAFAADMAVVELVLSIAERLKTMRRSAGFTQTQLAEQMGLSQGRVSQIESGLLDHAPNLETIARYAFACGVTARLEFSELADIGVAAAAQMSAAT